MKLIWHICKKDLLRLRFALGLWVLLLGSELFFNQRLFSPSGIDAAWFERAGLFANLFTLTPLIVGFLMMASLVLEDPTVGTQMFWATRPISGGRLLAAKLLGLLLLFGALPILVRLPWWLYCGYGPGDLARAALQSLSAVGLMAIPAVVLAALSGQSSRFLLYSFLLLLAFPLVSLRIAVRAGPNLNSDLVMSQVLVSVLLVAIGGLAAATAQFLTRRLVRSIAILSAGIAVAAVCLFTWPWRLDQLWPDDQTPFDGTDPISADILDANLSAIKNPKSSETSNLALTLRLNNVPDNQVPLSGLADVELRWPDGFVVRRERLRIWLAGNADAQALQRLLALPSYRPDPETAKKRAELREERLRRPSMTAPGNNRPQPALPGGGARFVVSLTFGPEAAARIKAQLPACTVSTRLILGRPALLFEMPMREGARQSGEGARLQILDLQKEPPGRDGQPDRPSPPWTLTLVSASAPDIRPLIYRVDRERGTFERIQNFTPSLPVLPVVAKIERISAHLFVEQIWRTNQWIDDPNWFSSQTLVAVTNRAAGGVTRTVHIDRLPLPPDPSE